MAKRFIRRRTKIDIIIRRSLFVVLSLTLTAVFVLLALLVAQKPPFALPATPPPTEQPTMSLSSPSPSLPSATASPSPTAVLPTPTSAPTLKPSISGTTLLKKPERVKQSEKVAYLSFDDGPGDATPLILDALDQKGVKATFFTIGNQLNGVRKDYLRREYKDGHTIGCHTYTHITEIKNGQKSPANIYSSPESLSDTIDKWYSAVTQTLGEDLPYKVMRFPGGSSTSQISAKKHGEQYYLAMLNAPISKGYRCFDWNALTNDSYYKDWDKTKMTLAQYQKNTLMQTLDAYEKTMSQYPLIILMHDAPNKSITAEILPWVIDYLKEKGYSFSTLDKLDGHYLH